MKSYPLLLQGWRTGRHFQREYLSSRICFTTSFPFDHSSFELSRVFLTLPQQNVHFFCLYRPPPSRKNKFTDSLFLDHFPDLLDRCNSLHGSLIILGDFNVHYDCPQNPTMARIMDLFFQFNLTQFVSKAIHKKDKPTTGLCIDPMTASCHEPLSPALSPLITSVSSANLTSLSLVLCPHL